MSEIQDETQEPQSEDASRPLTFGEQLVGVNFNPSEDGRVKRAKKICAELADMLQEESGSLEVTELQEIHKNHTLMKILDAQMNVVKSFFI